MVKARARPKVTAKPPVRSNGDRAAHLEMRLSVLDKAVEHLKDLYKDLNDVVKEIKARQDMYTGRLGVESPSTSEALKALALEVHQLNQFKDMATAHAGDVKDQRALYLALGGILVMAIPTILIIIHKLGLGEIQ